MAAVAPQSATLMQYKMAMKQCINLIYPNVPNRLLDDVCDYSINKRMNNPSASIENSYTHKSTQLSLLQVADYIAAREPIVTSFGTMFRKHGEVPNPMFETIQSFLDLRKQHKKDMFKFPKGSEDFEKFNLLQQLDKIDANG